jgi:hypothetical protein
VAFTGSAMAVHLLLAGAPGTTVTTGDGVGASMAERVPLADVTREGTQIGFVAVLEPVLAGQTPAVRDITAQEEDGSIAVQVSGSDGSDTYRIAWGEQIQTARSGREPAILPFAAR